MTFKTFVTRVISTQGNLRTEHKIEKLSMYSHGKIRTLAPGEKICVFGTLAFVKGKVEYMLIFA